MLVPPVPVRVSRSLVFEWKACLLLLLRGPQPTIPKILPSSLALSLARNLSSLILSDGNKFQRRQSDKVKIPRSGSRKEGRKEGGRAQQPAAVGIGSALP